MQQTMLATHQKFQQPNTDSYVLHEYLEPNNNQFYFTDFVEMLDKHALRYIGDSDITSMNTLNLGPQVDATLKQIHDLTLREQYIDYISNRAFRMAIITRQSSKPAAVNPEVATDLYFTSDLQAQTPPDAKGFIRFQKANTSLAININDPLLQALFKGMFEPRYKAYSFTEMVEIAVKALGEPQRDAIDKALRANLIPYALRNVLQVRLRPSRHTNVVSNKPQAYALSRYQAKFPNPAYIVTANHSFSRLTVFELAVLQYLDGTNSKDQIVEKAAEQLKSASMPIQHTDLTITDPGKIKGALKDNIASILQNIANQGILLA